MDQDKIDKLNKVDFVWDNSWSGVRGGKKRKG